VRPRLFSFAARFKALVFLMTLELPFSSNSSGGFAGDRGGRRAECVVFCVSLVGQPSSLHMYRRCLYFVGCAHLTDTPSVPEKSVAREPCLSQKHASRTTLFLGRSSTFHNKNGCAATREPSR
jgi:hypothetical protein